MVHEKLNKVSSTKHILNERHDCPKPFLWVPDESGSSFDVMKKYMYMEWRGLIVGIISLLLGTVAQFLTPLLVG